MYFEVTFTGHPNIRSHHGKTIEITKDSNLTVRGDCIIGVNASAACKDLPTKLKSKLRNSNTKVTITIDVEGKTFQIVGKGNESLVLSHDTDIVLRKSNFICPRTLAIKCDHASDSIPRTIIRSLRNPNTVGTLSIRVN